MKFFKIKLTNSTAIINNINDEHRSIMVVFWTRKTNEELMFLMSSTLLS